MKKLILSLVAIATISLSSFGQAPEGFKYQAVVRDAGNLILTNQTVGVLITIRQGSIAGTAIYKELFSTTTNSYGLVNLEIGNGVVVVGDFTTIGWANGPYFIETAIDVSGGVSYVVMGTSQLMSVPYALHSNTANTASTANTANSAITAITANSVINNIIELNSGTTYNNIDVTGISVVYANLDDGTSDVIINGFTNGVIGQVVYISNTANPYNNGVNIIISSNNVSGDQKFESPLNGGINYINSGRGIPCFFDGTKWIVMWAGM